MIPSVRGTTVSINENTYDTANIEKLPTQDFISPISEGEYYRRRTFLSAGKTAEGWVIFQIPERRDEGRS